MMLLQTPALDLASIDKATLGTQKPEVPHDPKFLESLKKFVSDEYFILRNYMKPMDPDMREAEMRTAENSLKQCLKLPENTSVKLLLDEGSESVFHFREGNEREQMKKGDEAFALAHAHLRGTIEYQEKVYDIEIDISSGKISINNREATTATIGRVLKECSKDYDKQVESGIKLIKSEESKGRQFIGAIRRSNGDEVFLFEKDDLTDPKLYVIKAADNQVIGCDIENNHIGRSRTYFFCSSPLDGKDPVLPITIGRLRKSLYISRVGKEECITVTKNYKPD